MKVYNKSGNPLLDIDENKELSRGGEGRVIEIPGDKVAKLYLPGVSVLKEDKFKELFELKSNSFIKPEELFYDNKQKVLGFSMKKVPQDHFPLLSIFNKTFCTRQGITFDTKKRIIERIVDAVKFAHTKNVVIGDLNPYNILVNETGSAYFIDVDSYQTPSYKHSGILLEDIRDFLYNGDVTLQSDYFALAVLAFNALTYVHPFKGVHKKLPKIADRMIRKESVLKPSPDLIIPKCYEPIATQSLVDQFIKIFNNGDRFVIQMTDVVVVNTVKIKSVTKTDQLIVHLVYFMNGSPDVIVTSASSKEVLVLLISNKDIRVYDLSIKGTSRLMYTAHDFDLKTRFFVYKTIVYFIEKNKLYSLVNEHITEILDFKTKVKAQLFGSTLVVVTDDFMYKFRLADEYGGKVPYDTMSVFGGRFTHRDGLFQNVSGNTVIFYEKGSLNAAILKASIKNIVQSENIGIIEKIENESITYKYFSIKNLQVELFDCPLDGIRYFDVLNENMIIVPEDDKLVFVRTTDMLPIVEFQCSEVSQTSVIHCTNAGIVVVNDNSVYLINKK